MGIVFQPCRAEQVVISGAGLVWLRPQMIYSNDYSHHHHYFCAVRGYAFLFLYFQTGDVASRSAISLSEPDTGVLNRLSKKIAAPFIA